MVFSESDLVMNDVVDPVEHLGKLLDKERERAVNLRDIAIAGWLLALAEAVCLLIG